MTESPDLVFPDWLPSAVRKQAENIYDLVIKNDDADAIVLLRRLTSDPRMKKVWDECSKKKQIPDRNIEEFYYPGAEGAVGYFFYYAYYYYAHPLPLVSVSEINTSIKSLFTTAQVLQKEAENLLSFGMEDEAHELERIASDCEKTAWWIEPDDDDSLIVDRRVADTRLRYYVALLGKTSRKLFGKSLSGTLATITNVVFDRSDITHVRIREILRARRDPGVKRRQSAR